MELDRRDLLMALASGTLFASTPLGALSAAPRRDWASALSELLPHAGSAQAVGRAYLDTRPEDFQPQTLLDTLFAGEDRADTRRLRDATTAAIRADFDAGRTVSLQGWILARTEVQLCAIVTLLAA
jgi:hypothetical protein